MDFNLTEEQLMIQQAARDFAQTELLPGVIERDNDQKFPYEQVKKWENLVLGMMVDPNMVVQVWIVFLMSWQWKKLLK
jgi:alkylation response protein AidB-like acyl-CoA dehydrogenase